MRKMLIGATFLVVASGAAAVGAIDNVAISGSDTLEKVTAQVLAACPAATSAGITYVGGGSTTGENAMVATTAGGQTVAPMSRFLGNAAAICTRAGATAEGIQLGYDGLSIVTDAVAGTCNSGAAISPTRVISIGTETGACPGCDAGNTTYTAVDWRDVLRLVYGGRHHDAPYTTANRKAGTVDCKSAVRKALLNNWSGSGARLEHAYRRSDLSGTTDTFIDLLGLPSMPTTATAAAYPFCNGWAFTAVAASSTPPTDDTSPRIDSGTAAASLKGGEGDFRDFDPVRRGCCGTDQVCRFDRTLGVVVPILVPIELKVDAASPSEPLYPTTLCTPGSSRFQLISATPGVNPFPFCPNGVAFRFNKCWNPVISATGDPRCIARTGVTFGQRGKSQAPDDAASAAADNDSRAWNLFPKGDAVTGAGDGYYLRDKFPIPGNAANTRAYAGAFYRQHYSTPAPGCTETDSTAQIGCLSRVQGCGCNIGFAGREAASNGTVALDVNNFTPSDANIYSGSYPLARKLYFNTLVGFGGAAGVTGGELELAKCMSNASIVNPILTSDKFLPNPPSEGSKPTCVDYNEQSLCGAASNFNACSDNPAGVAPNN